MQPTEKSHIRQSNERSTETHKADAEQVVGKQQRRTVKRDDESSGFVLRARQLISSLL